MKIIPKINYASDTEGRHEGDLYLPEGNEPHPIALSIHGGGWNANDCSSFTGVAEFLCEEGFATFNINYRLLQHAPWPACGDDCLQAARFLLDGKDKIPNLTRDKLLIAGASAGGHLALMTGLRLPPEKVSAIIDIAGVTDHTLKNPNMRFQLDHKLFWGHTPTQEEISAASPVSLIRANQPPVLCTHCPVDDVVGIEHSRSFVEKSRGMGANAELFEYNRPPDGHCIWIPESDPHKLFPEIEDAIRDFIAN